MTNEIETYKKAKADLATAKEWAGKIGKRYEGGGGGEGYLHACSVGATIYFQQSNGSMNYHNAPPEMCLALARALSGSEGIIDRAIEIMQARVDELAQKAVKAHTALMEEAGLA